MASVQSASDAPEPEAIVYVTLLATPDIADNETVMIALPSSSDGLDAEALPPLMFTAEKFKVGFVSSLLIFLAQLMLQPPVISQLLLL